MIDELFKNNVYLEALSRIVINYCCTCPVEHTCNLNEDCPFADDVKTIRDFIIEVLKDEQRRFKKI